MTTNVFVPVNLPTNTPELVNLTTTEASTVPGLGYSLYGRRRHSSRWPLGSAEKAYFTRSSHTSARANATPSTFTDATIGPDAQKWWAAIHQGFQSLIDNGSWEKIPRKDVPLNQSVMDCKWAFNVETDNVFKARLVIKGYR